MESFTVTLPAGTAGDIVAFKDYANTFDTNNLTIGRNGSEKFGGVAGDPSNFNGRSINYFSLCRFYKRLD